MSDYDDSYCPICTVSKLTAATKVYPICQCKLSICFECLRRWAETKYCCPFCNISFTQDALQQTEEDLKKRLRGQVSPDELEDVVKAWVDLLTSMRSGLEVGLALLNMDTLGDDAPDIFQIPLRRSRTPFLPMNWPSMSQAPSLNNSNSRFSLLMQPMLSNTASTVAPLTLITPELSVSSTHPGTRSVNQQGVSDVVNPLGTPEPSPDHLELNNSIPGRLNSAHHGVRSYSNELGPNDQLPRRINLRGGISGSAQWALGRLPSRNLSRTNLSANFDGTEELTLPMTLDEFNTGRSFSNSRAQSGHLQDLHKHSSIPPICDEKFGKFVKNNSVHVKSILSKSLHVRELVSIRSGTKLARTLEPNSVGVVMKHSGELRVTAGGDLMLERDRPMWLTVRLLDGSWLTKVQAGEVESRGERATLRQYLRVGDILWTRFGLAIARELKPRVGRVKVEFLGEFVNPREYASRGRDEVHEELRRMLFGSDFQKASLIVETSEEEERNQIRIEPSQIQDFLDDETKQVMLPSKIEETEESKQLISETDGNGYQKDKLSETVRNGPEMHISETSNNSRIDNMEARPTERLPDHNLVMVHEKSLDELIDDIESPNAFQMNNSFDKLSSISGNVVPCSRESYAANDPEDASRQSYVVDMLQNKVCSGPLDGEMKTSTLFMIYDTDIQTVLSSEEVFERIEKKIVRELFTAQSQLSHNPSWCLRAPSKREPPLQTFEEEKSDFNFGDPLLKRDLSYDDQLVSPKSTTITSPQNCTVRKIDFGDE